MKQKLCEEDSHQSYAGSEVSVIWVDADNAPLLIQVFIFYLSLYMTMPGKTERWKKSCTVIRTKV